MAGRTIKEKKDLKKENFSVIQSQSFFIKAGKLQSLHST